MPLTDQEQRCVDLTCSFLGKRDGGDWRATGGPNLDDLNPNVPSPEIVVSNGSKSAAIEVKLLVGDWLAREYAVSLKFLRQALVPTVGGSYTVDPCVGFHLPVDKQFLRHIRGEIERLAPELSTGDVAAILIEREAAVRYDGPRSPGRLRCCHTGSNPIPSFDPAELPGVFFIEDCGEREHRYVTRAGQRAASTAIVAACHECLDAGEATARWTEEWELICTGEGDRPGKVHMIAGMFGPDVSETVNEGVRYVVENALRKFENRRWAELHVLTLEKAGLMMGIDHVAAALEEFTKDELSSLDLILAIERDRIEQVWPSAG